MAVKRYKYSFTRKKHSVKGIISTGLAGISIMLFFAASICSLAFHGNGGMYLGAMGLAGMCISVYGFILGLLSFSEKNRDQLFCKTGSVANGMLMVVWLSLFLVGI